MRGNVFENLDKINEEGGLIENKKSSWPDMNGWNDFSTIDNRMENINKVTSETKRIIETLRSQIADLKAYLEGDHEDVEELYHFDKYFRLANLELSDEDKDLLHDPEDEGSLRKATLEVAQAASEVVKLAIKKRALAEGKGNLHEDYKEKTPWQTQGRGRKRHREAGQGLHKGQGGHGPISKMSKRSNFLSGQAARKPETDHERKVQEVGARPRLLPVRGKVDDGLQEGPRVLRQRRPRHADQAYRAHEAGGGLERAARSEVQTGGLTRLSLRRGETEPQVGETLQQKPGNVKYSPGYNNYCDVDILDNCNVLTNDCDLDICTVRQPTNRGKISDVLVQGTMGIPSKCEKCDEEFPSKQQLMAHKAKDHPKKPPGPRPQTPGPGIKHRDSKKNKTPKGAKTPNSTGSAQVMDNWMQGNSMSTAIGQLLSQARQDTPTGATAEPEVKTVDLDASINLLDTEEMRNNGAGAASPYLGTVRLFPPKLQLEADKLSNSWTVSQVSGVLDPEPEKKRSRSRDDDEQVPGSEKKVDLRRTPRNLENTLRNLQDTQEVMELEFNSVEVNTEEWETVTVAVTAGPEADSQESQNSQATTYVDSQASQASTRQLMSESETEWMNNDNFDNIPPSPELEERERQIDMIDAGYDALQQRDAVIEGLRSKLQDALSMKEEYWESMRDMDTKIANLESENLAMKAHIEGEGERGDVATRETIDAQTKVIQAAEVIKQLREQVQVKGDEILAKDAQLQTVKDQALNMMRKAKAEVDKVTAEVNEKAAEQAKKAEMAKRAEVEKLKAINTQSLNELKMHKVNANEVSQLKTALVKAEGARDIEKLKAEKAEDMMRKMEDIGRTAQEDRAAKDVRMSELETRIKTMARQLPCSRENCDFSCGRDHHCGSGRNRSRNRGQRNRSRGQSNDGPPTVQNLAQQAGVPVPAMQQVVNSAGGNQAQASRLPPRQPRAQSAGRQKPWNVVLCPAYHYSKLCPRGRNCKNTHELIPANKMGPAQGKSVRFPTPSYHPDHPHYEWAKKLADSSEQNMAARDARMAGNANGQMQGASSVLSAVPQEIMRPRSFSEAVAGTITSTPNPSQINAAASGSAAARMTVKETLRQLGSNRSKIQALQDPSFTAQLDDALGLITNTLPGILNSPSARNSPSSNNLTPTRTSTQSSGPPQPQPPAGRM